jgi:hypothetical protein
MLVIHGPKAAVLTTTEAKQDLPGAFRTAARMPVYVTKDGKPIGGLVSMEMLALLQRARAEREERRAKRANVTVRVVRRDEESPGDTTHMTPAERIGVMSAISQSAFAISEAAADAGA